jgi:ABC-type branched-subunit amino acid transport system ATPase component
VTAIVPAVTSLVRRPRVSFERQPSVATSATARRPAAVDPPLLVADSLTKRFGSVVAADAVSLALGPGEICALIGPNGSGKTTVLRLLAGVHRPDAGSVVFDGRDLDGEPPRERARRGLVRTLQGSAAFGELTALENLIVGSGLHRVHGGGLRTAVATPLARAEAAATRTAARAALADIGLAGAADVPAGELAGPEQRLLAVAAALATEARVLLLDEPSAGASLDDVRRLDALLSRLRNNGVAVLLVEHNLRLVRAVADRVIVIAAGAVIASGSPTAVAADPHVRTAYLGRAAL